MGFKNIEKRSIWYAILKKLIVTPWHNKVYYRKVNVNFKERIPKEGHLIFTPNHQNALMDALAPLCNINKQLVFVARSDIFKKKRIASILYFLKILPVFRIRDGYSSLKKNELIFQKTIDALNAENGLVILPEGNHITKYRLRQLKKGFARIAFQAAEKNGFSTDIQIVPVGLNYSDFYKFRSDLTINFGYPISVSEYYDLYKEEPAVGLNKLSARLNTELRPLMIHIESEEYYELYNSLRVMYREYYCESTGNSVENAYDCFHAEQEIIEILNDIEKNKNGEFLSIADQHQQYKTKLKEADINETDPQLRDKSWFSLMLQSVLAFLGLPIFIYGLVNNFIPWFITSRLVRKVKDPSFISSLRFVVSLIIFPTLYIIQSLVFLIITQNPANSIIYFLSLPLSGMIFWVYWSFVKKLRGFTRNKKFKFSKKTAYDELLKSKSDLDKLMEKILSR